MSNETKSDGKAMLPEGFSNFQTNRAVYKPDTAQGQPLQGWLLGGKQMPPTEKGKPWFAYIIHTTLPTKGTRLESKDEIIAIPAGEEVLIPVTHGLRDLAFKAADPKTVTEVYIRPTKKVKLGGTKSMWLYEVGTGKEHAREGTALALLTQSSLARDEMMKPSAVAPDDDDNTPF